MLDRALDAAQETGTAAAQQLRPQGSGRRKPASDVAGTRRAPQAAADLDARARPTSSDRTPSAPHETVSVALTGS